jgi:hypothetical protein
MFKAFDFCIPTKSDIVPSGPDEPAQHDEVTDGMTFV